MTMRISPAEQGAAVRGLARVQVHDEVSPSSEVGNPMKVDERVVERLAELIERGLQIEKTKKSPPPNFIGFDSTVDSQAGNQWHASAKNILAKSFGRDSEHYKLFDTCFEKGVTYSPLHRGIGILKAAKEDLEHGYIQDVRDLVAGELFSDLLDQSSELLDAGYRGPAAVLAGAVLEDHLRKLCGAREIELPARPKLDSMNAQLAKAGLYNRLTQKKLTAVAGIRNAAAHGQWEEFDTEDVADMIKWIAGFLEQHLG